MGNDEFGVRLRQARERARLTQAQLAGLADVARETLARIEGGRPPELATRVAIHAILVQILPGLTLDMHLTDPGDSVDTAVQRRTFLRAAAIVPPTLALRMIALDRSPTPTLDPALLDNWEARTANFAAARALEPPRLLLPQIENHLLVLESLIAQWPGPTRLRRRLLSIAAGTNAIAAWVSLMAEHRRETRDYLDRGETLAREVGDNDTLVLLLMLRSDLLSPVLVGGDGGFPAQALRALEEAMELSSPATPVTLRAPVILRAAEEHAFAGDGPATEQLLDEGAEVVASGRTPNHYLRRIWTSWAVDSYRGSAYQLLGRTREAIETLSAIDSPYPGHRPLMLADLGAAHAQEGDLDEAARVLVEALDQAAAHGLPEAARRVQGVRRRRLTRWNADRRVRDLDERIASIL